MKLFEKLKQKFKEFLQKKRKRIKIERISKSELWRTHD